MLFCEVPMNVDYLQFLRDGSHSFAEDRQEYLIFTERHLQALWLEQKYFKGLKTKDESAIEVLSPGLWNAGAGPDFLNAHFLIGGRELKGDVEIHLREGDWYSHRHHEDENYDAVVFHFVLWSSKKRKRIYTCSGKEVLSLVVEPNLTIPLKRIIKLIDIDLYPYIKFVGMGKCAKKLFHRLPEEEVKALFSDAAQWRLNQKYSYLQAWVEDPLHYAAAGIAMALGYKHNTQAFLELFNYLVAYRDLTEEQLLALGMGVCGFFEESFYYKWIKNEKYLSLYDQWIEFAAKVVRKAKLKLFQVRPLNHPIRRIAYLSKLLVDDGMEALKAECIIAWKQVISREKGKLQFKMLEKKLLDAIPHYEDEYWNSHYLFEENEAEKNLTLLGSSLRKEILVNTILPILNEYLEENRTDAEIEIFDAFYNKLSAEYNSKVRYLSQRFFGETQKGGLFRYSQMQQGAFQIHKDFCVHYEASCISCPFVERYKEAGFCFEDEENVELSVSQSHASKKMML